MRKIALLIPAMLLATIITSACSQRPAPKALLSARHSLQAAQELGAQAAVPELYDAAQGALAMAEDSWRFKDHPHLVEHQILLAQTKAETALLSVQTKHNQAKIHHDANWSKTVLPPDPSNDAGLSPQTKTPAKREIVPVAAPEDRLANLERELKDKDLRLKQLDDEKKRLREGLIQALSRVTHERLSKADDNQS